MYVDKAEHVGAGRGARRRAARRPDRRGVRTPAISATARTATTGATAAGSARRASCAPRGGTHGKPPRRASARRRPARWPQDWAAAHDIAQRHEGDAIADWLHAVLHKIEGDDGNARYWYRRTPHRFEEFADPQAELAAIRDALISLSATPPGVVAAAGPGADWPACRFDVMDYAHAPIARRPRHAACRLRCPSPPRMRQPLPDKLTFGYDEEGKVDASKAGCEAYVKENGRMVRGGHAARIRDVCAARKAARRRLRGDPEELQGTRQAQSATTPAEQAAAVTSHASDGQSLHRPQDRA